MMSSNRSDYGSASEWLAALREDAAWVRQLKQLQTSSEAEVNAHRDTAMRRIERGVTFEFWEIYEHEVEPVVKEVWGIAELSLLALEQKLSHAVHHLHQHTLDHVAAVERTMLRDVAGEVIECQKIGNLCHAVGFGLSDVGSLGAGLRAANYNTIVNHTL